MTRDDIIRMAREAGYPDYVMGLATEAAWSQVLHFAALVAAAEREACAAICDEMMRQLGEIGETVEAGGAGYCAEEIRRRGET